MRRQAEALAAQVERAARVRAPALEEPAPVRVAERAARLALEQGRAVLARSAALLQDPAQAPVGTARAAPARVALRPSVPAGPMIRPEGNDILAL